MGSLQPVCAIKGDYLSTKQSHPSYSSPLPALLNCSLHFALIPLINTHLHFSLIFLVAPLICPSSPVNFVAIIILIMRASTTIALLSAIALIDISFARPLSGSSTGQGVHDVPHRAPVPHSVANAQVHPAQSVGSVPASLPNSEPLPRRLSRRTNGASPMGHRPADLGADNLMISENGISTIPRQRSLRMAERKDLPLVKRHDHINSPEAATVGSCNGKSLPNIVYHFPDSSSRRGSMLPEHPSISGAKSPVPYIAPWPLSSPRQLDGWSSVHADWQSSWRPWR